LRWAAADRVRRRPRGREGGAATTCTGVHGDDGQSSLQRELQADPQPVPATRHQAPEGRDRLDRLRRLPARDRARAQLAERTPLALPIPSDRHGNVCSHGKQGAETPRSEAASRAGLEPETNRKRCRGLAVLGECLGQRHLADCKDRARIRAGRRGGNHRAPDACYPPLRQMLPGPAAQRFQPPPEGSPVVVSWVLSNLLQNSGSIASRSDA
jgi:hypothetical protein